jgi:rod shape-determining protein MreD
MKVRFLKALNIPGLFLITLLLLTLQSTLFTHPALRFFQPDLVLFLVLWVGVKRSFVEGGWLTLGFGYLVELLSGAPQGLYLTVYTLIYFATRMLNQNFQILNRRTITLLGIGTSVLARLLVLLILFVLDKADNKWFHTLQLLAPTAIIHGVLVGWFFRMFYRFDDWTLKNPEAEHRYESEYYLDEEWV